MASLFNIQSNLREAARVLPDKPVAMPYDMRNEVTWIDFTNHTNPLGTPKPIVQEIHTALVDGEHCYIPDHDGRSFRHSIGNYLGLAAENILLGTSVSQLITYAACAFDYTTVGVSEPCPLSYETAIGNAGHSILPLQNPISFAPVDAHHAFQQGNFKGMVLGNPTYPTSRLIPKPQLKQYLETLDWLIVDESNIELTIGGESAVGLVESYPNLIVIRSASTTYGMPGIPICYMVAHHEMISHIEQFYAGNDIGMFGEVLAYQLVSQNIYLDETHDFLENEIPWMQCHLSLLPGVNIFPAEANFVLCEYNPSPNMELGVDSVAELVTNLQLAGFLVDDLHDTPGLPHENFFCVAVRLREENERLLSAMRSIIKSFD